MDTTRYWNWLAAVMILVGIPAVSYAVFDVNPFQSPGHYGYRSNADADPAVDGEELELPQRHPAGEKLPPLKLRISESIDFGRYSEVTRIEDTEKNVVCYITRAKDAISCVKL